MPDPSMWKFSIFNWDGYFYTFHPSTKNFGYLFPLVFTNIAGMTKLEGLYLDSCRISNDGLAHLAGICKHDLFPLLSFFLQSINAAVPHISFFCNKVVLNSSSCRCNFWCVGAIFTLAVCFVQLCFIKTPVRVLMPEGWIFGLKFKVQIDRLLYTGMLCEVHADLNLLDTRGDCSRTLLKLQN